MINPIFIFSLPRSGSTLLQRILSSDKRISTRSESWLLLPIMYSRRKEGCYSVYNHNQSCNAIEDFVRGMNGGEEVFRESVRLYAENLYKAASNEKTVYFLEKTPRYGLIAKELMQTFPDGKFIFLWRNPLSIVSSLITSWGNGKWVVNHHSIDLFACLDSMIEASETTNQPKISVNFETLLSDSTSVIDAIYEYLELSPYYDGLKNIQDIKLDGRMGDKIGTEKYSKIDIEPIEKWKVVLSNPVRRFWARKYLDWIGEERLSTIGYDYLELKKGLNLQKISLKYTISDTLKITKHKIRNPFAPYILKDNFKKLFSRKLIYTLR